MTLTSIPLSFCVPIRGSVANPVYAAGAPGYVACFSSDREAADFLSRHGESDWDLLKFYRGDLPAVAADLQRAGALGLLFDPAGAADKVSFAEG